LITIDENWMMDTKVKCFNQIDMLACFKAPWDYITPRHTELQLLHGPPDIRKLMAFWGPESFNYMVDRMRQQLVTQRHSNKGLGLMRSFEIPLNEVQFGMVYSDGTKDTQRTPMAAGQHEPGQWWPVLVAPSVYNTCTQLAVYCQAQALAGGRPWETDISRVCTFATDWLHSPPSPISTPGVIIEEMDSQSESEWVQL
jgi:hypothetical protein